MFDFLYACVGVTPGLLILVWFLADSTYSKIAWSTVVVACTSCINLEWGGMLGWFARPFVWLAGPYCFALTMRWYVDWRGEPKQREKVNNPRKENSTALPSLDLLERPKYQYIATQDRSDELLGVLKDFGIEGVVRGMQSGPAVTLYEFEPAAGLKISKIIALTDDIARSMSAMSVRIAKVPGKNFIGIELANQSQATVYFRDVIKTASDCALPLGLGKGIAGEPMVADLAAMPHLLVAGTTGSGKSVAIHSMLLSLLYKRTHKELRLLLVDPKMLEFTAYNAIPHLLHPVVTDPKEAVAALKWVVGEMERRYKTMSDCNVRNIIGYNKRFSPMPYIVVVVDEMADLMVVAGKEIECAVQRLAQMARASGIHIIMATQRPSVDVITGTIKANFPSRISFQVSSKIDSRTIIGEQGAEQLLGRGDMLYLSTGGKLVRVHGPFVNEHEVNRVTDFLRTLAEPEYVADVTVAAEEIDSADKVVKDTDAKYEEALELVRRSGKASTSFLVTNMGIGYNRASRIIQQMEREGVISPAQGATHTRQILKW